MLQFFKSSSMELAIGDIAHLNIKFFNFCHTLKIFKVVLKKCFENSVKWAFYCPQVINNSFIAVDSRNIISVSTSKETYLLYAISMVRNLKV